MGRELTGKGISKTPKVILNEKENVRFTGRVLSVKDSKLGRIYEFAAMGGDAPIRIKTGEKQYQDVDVAEGDKVAVFGSTQLDDKLSGAQVGEVIEIVYHGKKRNEK